MLSRKIRELWAYFDNYFEYKAVYELNPMNSQMFLDRLLEFEEMAKALESATVPDHIKHPGRYVPTDDPKIANLDDFRNRKQYQGKGDAA